MVTDMILPDLTTSQVCVLRYSRTLKKVTQYGWVARGKGWNANMLHDSLHKNFFMVEPVQKKGQFALFMERNTLKLRKHIRDLTYVHT